MAALNPQYEEIAKSFVAQYYTLFDDPAQRAQVVNLYNPETSLMTFEGFQSQGAVKIMEKFSSLTFQKIAHQITTMDAQPMFGGGIMIIVLGNLKTDNDAPLPFTHTFVLQPAGASFFISNEVFRLNLA